MPIDASACPSVAPTLRRLVARQTGRVPTLPWHHHVLVRRGRARRARTAPPPPRLSWPICARPSPPPLAGRHKTPISAWPSTARHGHLRSGMAISHACQKSMAPLRHDAAAAAAGTACCRRHPRETAFVRIRSPCRADERARGGVVSDTAADASIRPRLGRNSCSTGHVTWARKCGDGLWARGP